MPEIGFGLSNVGRDYRLVWRLVREVRTPGAGSFALSLEAVRCESANSNAVPEHLMGLRLEARF